MFTKVLDEKNLDQFKAFCRRHKTKHDESYLYEEDLDDFNLDRHPTVLLYDGEKLIGVYSVMLDEYFMKAKKTRIRILYCESGQIDHYKMLINAMPLLEGINQIEAFMPADQIRSIDIFKLLGFDYYRTSYIMRRESQDRPGYNFPDKYSLKPFLQGKDEIDFQRIRNEAFKNLKGSEQPLTLDMVKSMTSADYLLKDGIQLLYFEDQAIGLVRVQEDEDDSGNISFVAPIALMPDHQGKGLGRQLLNVGILLGYENNLPNCGLCVNAENENALSIYKKAGFKITKAFGCYHMNYKS